MKISRRRFVTGLLSIPILGMFVPKSVTVIGVQKFTENVNKLPSDIVTVKPAPIDAYSYYAGAQWRKIDIARVKPTKDRIDQLVFNMLTGSKS